MEPLYSNRCKVKMNISERNNEHNLEHGKFRFNIRKKTTRGRSEAQRCSVISILGDIQNITGCGPKQPSVVDLVLS